MNQVRTYEEALSFLDSLFTKKKTVRHTAEIGIERTKAILAELGNPQEKINVIHIAGTAGKGSTAYYTNYLLQKHAFNVGLHISPHLEDIRERFQINNEFISQEEFIQVLNTVIIKTHRISNTLGSPTFYEYTVIMAFILFYNHKVDYAVIETGVGGLYDMTNVIENRNKICIITRIGHDHTKLLGTTYAQIGFQKSGIIQKENVVITLPQRSNAQKVIMQKVYKEKARMYVIPKQKLFNIKKVAQGISFTFSFQGFNFRNLLIPNTGYYQVENIYLALTTLILISQRDAFSIQEQLIRECLRKVKLKSRFEIINKDKQTILLDGAHNPLEIRTLVKSCRLLYPNQKFTVVFSCTNGANYKAMINALLPIANEFILTSYHSHTDGIQISSVDPIFLKELFDEFSYCPYRIIKDPYTLLSLLKYDQSNPILITGSIYLKKELHYNEYFKV